ncbi:phosphoribosyl-AMP cyclohydrolase [Neptunomonas sp.]|uniref:phosphoribosyl-AMP cyclohydrolase n=1 Tax=Neptunomonas sp. TaxID=1971898 RepID=UPI0025EA06C6|nr:phosphoribosyl-AMP cyclohydrolase [Neptunomonas sp.]
MSIWLQLEQAEVGQSLPLVDVLDAIPWNANGLVATIAQQHDTGEVLMLAWMNRTALEETLVTGRVCYWSRSRQQLWRKGETSGHRQYLIEARLDCDGDAILLRIEQQGPACHTGRPSCFYNSIQSDQVVVISAPQ